MGKTGKNSWEDMHYWDLSQKSTFGTAIVLWPIVFYIPELGFNITQFYSLLNSQVGSPKTFDHSYTKNWFIVVWQKENNFPISRRRKMVHCRFPNSFTKKWQFTSLVSCHGEKRHHSYEVCTIVTSEIIHIENVHY